MEFHQFESGHATVHRPMAEPFGGAVSAEGLHRGAEAGGRDFGEGAARGVGHQTEGEIGATVRPQHGGQGVGTPAGGCQAVEGNGAERLDEPRALFELFAAVLLGLLADGQEGDKQRGDETGAQDEEACSIGGAGAGWGHRGLPG